MAFIMAMLNMENHDQHNKVTYPHLFRSDTLAYFMWSSYDAQLISPVLQVLALQDRMVVVTQMHTNSEMWHWIDTSRPKQNDS